jgi:coproporphyrinogen III oxidase
MVSASIPSDASSRGRAAHTFFLDVQDRITEALVSVDGQSFKTDEWKREEGGGGRSRVLMDGRIFEKAGVNVSLVFGELPDSVAKDMPGQGLRFLATGVSLVLHPRSPHVPTVHANFRYLERSDGASSTGWFGGGSDLTPYILYDEDAIHFHQTWRDVCARHPVADYGAMKKTCDEYFFLPHRNERRGVGGIFFDYLQSPDPQDSFRFVKDAASSFLDAYLPIVDRRKDLPHSEEERTWQLTRRGRYVEFNLVYDRGTIFGLKTKGRTESILMSLPSAVRWGYDEHPLPNSYQSRLVDVLVTPKEWVAG